MATHLKTVKAKRGTSHVPDVFRPSIHLEEDQLKEIKNWEVGENYTLILEVTQKSKRENENKKINTNVFFMINFSFPDRTFSHNQHIPLSQSHKMMHKPFQHLCDSH